MDKQRTQELREIAFVARNAGRDIPPVKYVTMVMLDALDEATGNTEQTLKLLKKVHDARVESAPDDLKEVLSVVFSEFFRGILDGHDRGTENQAKPETEPETETI